MKGDSGSSGNKWCIGRLAKQEADNEDGHAENAEIAEV
jgi:hypothetical protein